MKPFRIASDRWDFETAPGEYITPLGGNMDVAFNSLPTDTKK
jgi:hypothetical protein